MHLFLPVLSYSISTQGRRKVWNIEGACSTVVGIICPLVEIGLTVLPNIALGGLKPPKSPPCDGLLLQKQAFQLEKNRTLLIAHFQSWILFSRILNLLFVFLLEYFGSFDKKTHSYLCIFFVNFDSQTKIKEIKTSSKFGENKIRNSWNHLMSRSFIHVQKIFF